MEGINIRIKIAQIRWCVERCVTQLRGDIGVQYFAENDYLGTADRFFFMGLTLVAY